jgi:hypothetical protein
MFDAAQEPGLVEPGGVDNGRGAVCTDVFDEAPYQRRLAG